MRVYVNSISILDPTVGWLSLSKTPCPAHQAKASACGVVWFHLILLVSKYTLYLIPMSWCPWRPLPGPTCVLAPELFRRTPGTAEERHRQVRGRCLAPKTQTIPGGLIVSFSIFCDSERNFFVNPRALKNGNLHFHVYVFLSKINFPYCNKPTSQSWDHLNIQLKSKKVAVFQPTSQCGYQLNIQSKGRKVTVFKSTSQSWDQLNIQLKGRVGRTYQCAIKHLKPTRIHLLQI